MVARSIHAMILYVYIERVTSRKRIKRFGSRCDDSGVAGEGRVVDVPKFHS